MPTTSRVPLMISALVARFTADPGIGAASPPVTVVDGPKVTAETGALALWVGVDEIDNPTPIAANAEQQWMTGMGRTNRTEQLSVHCTVQAKSGSDEIAPLRAQVAAILAAAEALLAADPGLGGLLTGRDAGVTGAEWRQYPTSPGMAVRVMFTISATAIIGAP
jgi:hypothetical protein